MQKRGYRWALIIIAGSGCALIAGVASNSFVLAGLVFAVVVSAAILVESA